MSLEDSGAFTGMVVSPLLVCGALLKYIPETRDLDYLGAMAATLVLAPISAYVGLKVFGYMGRVVDECIDR